MSLISSILFCAGIIDAEIKTDVEVKMDGDASPVPWGSSLWYEDASILFRVEYHLSKRWLIDMEFERPLFYLYVPNSIVRAGSDYSIKSFHWKGILQGRLYLSSDLQFYWVRDYFKYSYYKGDTYDYLKYHLFLLSGCKVACGKLPLFLRLELVAYYSLGEISVYNGSYSHASFALENLLKVPSIQMKISCGLNL